MNYTDLLSLVRTRRSIRKFSVAPVSREDLLRVLEAARWAPSNHNRQPWRFIVLEDKSQIAGLAERVSGTLAAKLVNLPAVASGYAAEFSRYATFFSQAPVLILVLHKHPAGFSQALLREVGQPELVSGEPLSAAMAVQNLLLAAHALGLGSCVLTAPLVVREVLSGEVRLPAGHDPTCFVALGWPAEEPPPPRRKNIEQIAEFRKDAAKPRSP